MEKIFFITVVFLSMGASLFGQKIIAREVVYVDAYEFRQNETLCKGIAKQAGNAFLQSGTMLDKRSYCKKSLKSRMVYPASSCSLPRMTAQCIDEIERNDH